MFPVDLFHGNCPVNTHFEVLYFRAIIDLHTIFSLTVVRSTILAGIISGNESSPLKSVNLPEKIVLSFQNMRRMTIEMSLKANVHGHFTEGCFLFW